jgi:heme exporter protein A
MSIQTKTEKNNTAFITIEDLKRNYDGVEALRGINLTLNRGDFLTIFGPNGAGKTTLIRIISTLLPPSSGDIKVSGYDMDNHPAEFRKTLGIISHQTLLYHDMTAKENLEFYAGLYGIRDTNKRIEDILKLMGLYERRDSRVSKFSRGMQQRLTIARALINDPSLILLDEPYNGLDQHASALLSDQLIKLHDRKRTIIMVTHNLIRGMEVATKVGILVKGRMLFLKDRDEISGHGFDDIYFHYVSGDIQ